MLQDLREQGVLEQDGQGWRYNVAALRQSAEEQGRFRQVDVV